LTATRLELPDVIIGYRAQPERLHAMVRCLVIVIAAFLTLASSSASAQTVKLDEYQHPSEPRFKEFNQIYLKGVVDGFMAYSVADAKNRFFCIRQPGP
jgi:hypothetical protein